jgi:hypothetical protein
MARAAAVPRFFLYGEPPRAADERFVHIEIIADRSTLYDCLEAKRTLIYTSMTVTETAHELGFDDPAYFSRFFSERVGCSPASFRLRTESQAARPESR